MPVVTKNQLLQILPAYQGRSILIEADQEVKEIIREILTAHQKFAADYDKIAPYFLPFNSLEELASSLYVFCADNIRYKAEPDSRQTTKSPAAILSQGQGDCKHYASFIGGVLDAITRTTGKKIDWCYRFASYNLFDSTPGHVFAVLKEGPKEYWIDPVLPTFDNRKQYFFKIDKRPPMSLYRVSGTEPQNVGSLFSKAFDLVKKVMPFSIAARNAFLGLVALNVHGFATALLSQDPAAVKKRWESLGGNYNDLMNTVRSGAKKKRLLGIEGLQISGFKKIGDPVTATALLTAAATVIAALGSLLKEVKPAGTPEASPEDQPIDQVIEDAKDQAKDQASKTDYTKYALIGGAALAAYFLFSKKK